MMENREVLAACEVEFAGPAPGPRLDWHIANVTHQGPTGAPKTRYMVDLDRHDSYHDTTYLKMDNFVPYF